MTKEQPGSSKKDLLFEASANQSKEGRLSATTFSPFTDSKTKGLAISVYYEAKVRAYLKLLFRARLTRRYIGFIIGESVRRWWSVPIGTIGTIQFRPTCFGPRPICLGPLDGKKWYRRE